MSNRQLLEPKRLIEKKDKKIESQIREKYSLEEEIAMLREIILNVDLGVTTNPKINVYIQEVKKIIK